MNEVLLQGCMSTGEDLLAWRSFSLSPSVWWRGVDGSLDVPRMQAVHTSSSVSTSCSFLTTTHSFHGIVAITPSCSLACDRRLLLLCHLGGALASVSRFCNFPKHPYERMRTDARDGLTWYMSMIFVNHLECCAKVSFEINDIGERSMICEEVTSE